MNIVIKLPRKTSALRRIPTASALRTTHDANRSATAASQLLIAALLLSSAVAFAAGSSGGAKDAPSPTVASSTATGSIPISATTVCSDTLTLYSLIQNPLDELLVYWTADWNHLQSKLADIANAIHKEGPCKGQIGKETSRRSFVFIDDNSPQPTIVRVLQGVMPEPDLGSVRLLDLYVLYTIYIYRLSTPTPPIYSTYSASPSTSPIQASVSQLVSSAAGGLAKIPSPAPPKEPPLSTKDIGPVAHPPPPKRFTEKIRIVVTKTNIPERLRWAQVSAIDTVNLYNLLTCDSIMERITRRFGASNASCGAFNVTLAGNCRAFIKPDNAQPYLKALGDELRDMLEKNPGDWDIVTAIYNMYAAAVTATAQVSLQSNYTYGRLTRWTFGLGVGFVAHPNLNEQVKLDNGVLVQDQLNGVMTSANAYFSFRGYDETTLTPTSPELWPRIVLGVVVTPNAGVFLGLAEAFPFPAVRHLTLNAGYALMLATVPENGDQVGSSTKTTKRGALGAWSVQLGYSF